MQKRLIGLHLRLQNELFDAMELARDLDISVFQSFLSIKGSGQRMDLTYKQIIKFVDAIEHFDAIFFHASYKVNPASCSIEHHYLLEFEVRLAERLDVPFLILHPGSALGCHKRIDALDALAKTLNAMQKKYSRIIFILENVAHGNACVGCDMYDFQMLIPKLEYPDRVKFCIDTAHAFSYGYDIRDEKSREEFIQLLDDTLGIANIMVLHINDTSEKLASKHDRHAVPGKGSIGHDALRAFAMHPKLMHIPIILELPDISLEECKEVLALVKSWHQVQSY